ncbi:hypothetical protein NQ315_001872 [Exocentrus adspersus]|uniref:Uncharacterized protein n=1 Tax=Exocentrus adspersus TaxID=1586481 RepID=A0AAV8W9W1_9CUCU|nr:hypothetical protein NQ315_001872 [Exocentrus adspersus]
MCALSAKRVPRKRNIGVVTRRIFLDSKKSFKPIAAVFQIVYTYFISSSTSVRGFGNRIARIFTRKKNRQLEISKPINEQNPKANETTYIANPLTPVNGEHFPRCTNHPLETRNHNIPQITVVAESETAPESNQESFNNPNAMENKPKDINQLYREMEEAVAQKVRETMELADAKRRAMTTGTLITRQKQIIISVEDKPKDAVQEVAETSQGLMNALDTSLHNVTEHITNKLNENKDATRLEGDDVQLNAKEMRREFEDINRTVEEEQAKIYRVLTDESKDKLQIKSTSIEQDTSAENLTDTNPVTSQIYHLEETPSLNQDNFQIGFAHFEQPAANDTVPTQPSEPFREGSEHQFGQDALDLALQSLKNVNQHLPDTTSTSEQIAFKNNPFELAGDVDLMKAGEDALVIAENAVQSYSNNPFESSDDEIELKFDDDDVDVRETVFSTHTNNPFDIIDDELQIRQLGHEALNIAQNAPVDFTSNPFQIVDDEDDLKQLGTDALTIAQAAARNIEAEKKQMSENAEDIDNAFNSLIDSTDLQNPTVQIGFDQFTHSLDELDDNLANTNLRKASN